MAVVEIPFKLRANGWRSDANTQTPAQQMNYCASVRDRDGEIYGVVERGNNMIAAASESDNDETNA